MNDDTTFGIPPEDLLSSGGEVLPDALNDLIRQRAARGDAAPLGAESLRSLPLAPPAAGECPEPGEWELLLDAHVAARDFERAGVLLVHASACRRCAERLRVLAGEETPEEEAALMRLASATVDGKRRMVEALARTPVASQSGKALSGKPSRTYWWVGAGLAASLLIALGLVGWWRVATDPERLLAEAYTQDRIFDLRMPGAGFADVRPTRHVRGASTDRQPESLKKAQEHIDSRLAAAPENAHWLQLEARADLLEEKYDAAIAILDGLIAAGQPSASLLQDDASAHFARGVATGEDADQATALAEFRRADELAPSDPVGLFNEAIAMENRGELVNAVETWNRYLRFERDPHWQADGRRRLQALEQKLNALKAHRG